MLELMLTDIIYYMAYPPHLRAGQSGEVYFHKGTLCL